jgi:hypothetical protein
MSEMIRFDGIRAFRIATMRMAMVPLMGETPEVDMVPPMATLRTPIATIIVEVVDGNRMTRAHPRIAMARDEAVVNGTVIATAIIHATGTTIAPSETEIMSGVESAVRPAKGMLVDGTGSMAATIVTAHPRLLVLALRGWVAAGMDMVGAECLLDRAIRPADRMGRVVGMPAVEDGRRGMEDRVACPRLDPVAMEGGRGGAARSLGALRGRRGSGDRIFLFLLLISGMGVAVEVEMDIVKKGMSAGEGIGRER